MLQSLMVLSILCFLSNPCFAEKTPQAIQVEDYLAVFDLEVTQNVDRSFSRPLSDTIRREVLLLGKYKVIERSQMDKILKEQTFEMTGCVAKACAVEAGQLLGVGKVIIGSLGLMGKTYYLSLSRVNVKTGEAEAIEEEICKCEPDELIASTKRAAQKLMGEKVAEGPKPPEPPVGEPLKPAEHRSPSEKTHKDPSTGMEFVLIPPGRFTMGSPSREEGRWEHEGPQHEVTLSRPFYLSKYEVTQAQWQAVMENNPSHFKGYDQCPVEQVSWNDIQEFIRRLNERGGTTGYRLPTEAEWEYACRAGSQTAYSFGDDAGGLGWFAWYSGNSGGKTHPVGQKRPNAWGLYDMHGNVWEWCHDWYEDYPSNSVADPTGPSSRSSRNVRVVRGGSWNFDPRILRAANRSWIGLWNWAVIDPSNRCEYLGFRLVFSPRQ